MSFRPKLCGIRLAACAGLVGRLSQFTWRTHSCVLCSQSCEHLVPSVPSPDPSRRRAARADLQLAAHRAKRRSSLETADWLTPSSVAKCSCVNCRAARSSSKAISSTMLRAHLPPQLCGFGSGSVCNWRAGNFARSRLLAGSGRPKKAAAAKIPACYTRNSRINSRIYGCMLQAQMVYT